MIIKNSNRKVNEDIIEKILKDENISKSEKMRKLFSEGVSVSKISKLLNCCYSFVYEVIKKEVDKNNIEVEIEKRGEVKEEILKWWREGKSIGEISRILNKNYNYVWVVVNKERKKEK